MQVLPKLFKFLPWVDLDAFYPKVKFGHIGFCMGKSENYLFLETVASWPSCYENCMATLVHEKFQNDISYESAEPILMIFHIKH